MTGKMTETQRQMARHALGLVEGRKTSYRNYYSAWIGGQAESDWNDLVNKGYAERGTPGASLVGFCLTNDGAHAVLLPGESLDPEDFPAAGRRAIAQEVER